MGPPLRSGPCTSDDAGTAQVAEEEGEHSAHLAWQRQSSEPGKSTYCTANTGLLLAMAAASHAATRLPSDRSVWSGKEVKAALPAGKTLYRMFTSVPQPASAGGRRERQGCELHCMNAHAEAVGITPGGVAGSGGGDGGAGLGGCGDGGRGERGGGGRGGAAGGDGGDGGGLGGSAVQRIRRGRIRGHQRSQRAPSSNTLLFATTDPKIS